MVTGTTEGALDESIIVKMDAAVEAFAINLIDSIEIGSCNFVRCLLDAAELSSILSTWLGVIGAI